MELIFHLLILMDIMLNILNKNHIHKILILTNQIIMVIIIVIIMVISIMVIIIIMVINYFITYLLLNQQVHLI